MSITESSPTLFYDLLAPRPGVARNSFPATDLIYKLLHHIATDVSSFRRNCQVSYRLIEYARDVYDGINTRILQAEESGSWEHYDAYNQAIPALEEVLLSIMEVTEVERDEYLVGSAGYNPDLIESMAGWIEQSITDWQKRREKIRNVLDKLRTEEAFKDMVVAAEDYEHEVYDARVHDDQIFLQNLLTPLEDNKRRVERGKSQNSEMVGKAKENLQSVLDLLRASPKTVFEQELLDLAIKCAMTAYAITEVMKRDEIKMDPELYDRVYGNHIWDTAQGLASI
ncbi:unnamed protein product [Rhizoctonia solani]|uniref:Uncharacterized protein n=1 Tax=Rhizoctonia solani TaxID=456999 RepID=A0A8H3GRB1_9AGAM|nr:unnamed protein product [Rhizoctonia solani]